MTSDFSLMRRRKKTSFPEPFSSVKDMDCPSCHQELKRNILTETLLVCPECSWHIPMHPYDRIHTLVDADSFREFSQN